MKKILLFISTTLSFFSHAINECPPTTTDQVYIGDNGSFWMIFANGGSAYITDSDPDFQNLYSLVLAAHMAQKPIRVRFAEVNAQCDAPNRNDIVGIWITK